MDYIFQSTQGHNLLFVAILGIGITAALIALVFSSEKKHQAGKEDEH